MQGGMARGGGHLKVAVESQATRAERCRAGRFPAFCTGQPTLRVGAALKNPQALLVHTG